MFDPNVSDPLVLERGTEAYGLTVKMDAIASAAIYTDFAVSLLDRFLLLLVFSSIGYFSDLRLFQMFKRS